MEESQFKGLSDSTLNNLFTNFFLVDLHGVRAMRIVVFLGDLLFKWNFEFIFQLIRLSIIELEQIPNAVKYKLLCVFWQFGLQVFVVERFTASFNEQVDHILRNLN